MILLPVTPGPSVKYTKNRGNEKLYLSFRKRTTIPGFRKRSFNVGC